MSVLLEFLVIAAFLIAYLWKGIFVATAVIMIGSVFLLAVSWLRERRIRTMPLITAILALVLGGVTLLLHDPVFIKWKFSIVEWLFGLVILASQYLGEKPLMQRLMDHQVTIPEFAWRRLNLMWSAFFLMLGSVNVYVIYHYDTRIWVYFKTYGVIAAMLVFIIVQAFYVMRHIEGEESE